VVGVGQRPWLFGPGNDPEPFAEVRSSNVGSGNDMPFCVIPEGVQVTEDFPEGSSSVDSQEVSDVLHEHVPRS
jgi:hypothetical protein